MGKYLFIALLFINSTYCYAILKQNEDTALKNSANILSLDTAKNKIESTVKNDGLENKKPVIKSNFRTKYLSLNKVAIYASIFLFMIMLILFSKSRATNKIGKKNISELERKLKERASNITELTTSLAGEKRKLVDLTEKHNELLERLNTENPSVRSSQTISSDSIDYVSQPIELEVENTLPKIEEAKILFFPNPNGDGTFKNSEGSKNFIEGASLYKFTILKETTALVEICDDNSSLHMVLNNRNDLILNAATETNAYNPNASQILIVDNKKAKAQLEGNIWVIKEKARIKYV